MFFLRFYAESKKYQVTLTADSTRSFVLHTEKALHKYQLIAAKAKVMGREIFVTMSSPSSSSQYSGHQS
jgi:hypothetical protein